MLTVNRGPSPQLPHVPNIPLPPPPTPQEQGPKPAVVKKKMEQARCRHQPVGPTARVTHPVNNVVVINSLLTPQKQQKQKHTGGGKTRVSMQELRANAMRPARQDLDGVVRRS